MKTIKLSYSILNAWATGNYEQAVGYYLGDDMPATPAMELGRLKHEIWANHTLKTQELHDDFGGGLLLNPIVEQKYEKIIPLSEDYQILFRGVIDLEHAHFDGTVEDYKCGQTPASQYVDSHQLGCYKILRPHAKVGVYRCYNPYTKQVTKGVKFLTARVAEDALEYIITFGSEMIQYLEANKLARNYEST